ncbi:MAG: transporter related protein, partial [Frankiales bacterium]|nr:transporter related protein [Frankiales bacterium]
CAARPRKASAVSIQAGPARRVTRLACMAEFVYVMQKVRKAVGDKVILDDVTLSFIPGAKIGVVGPNGAGKSTVLKMMAGLDQPSTGEAKLSAGFSVGILMQEPKLDESKTVKENVEDGVRELMDTIAKYNELNEQMAEPDADFEKIMAEQEPLIALIEARNGWEVDSLIEQAMDALRCPPPDEPVTHLSGGERRRVALCKLLLEAPDLLLLDEPTNHLDAESVEWLENHLARYPGAVLAVTHDRYFLDNVAEWILELDRGRAYPYEGNYSTYLEKKQERLAVQGKKDAKLSKRLKDELEWVRQNAKGRQTKSKSRLARYEEMAAEAEKTRKLDFEEIQIPAGPRLGSVVIEAKGLTKGFGDRVLIDDLSFTMPRGGIIGIIGPNGVGKTTLFKTIVGLEQPDSGEVRVGETVKLSYVDQNRDSLDPTKSVWEAVSEGLDYIQVGQQEMPSRAYIGAFGFKGPDQQKPTGVLSGGERNRLNLALTLKEGGNVLLLDEPTNDLDVETLGSLENALLEFPGCAVVISHDRWFLDRVATHILAWEGDEENPSKWYWFEGNFESYEKNKIDRMGQDAARPHRVTYRKLTRD